MSNVVPLYSCVCGKAGVQREVGLSDGSDDPVNFISCDDCLATSVTFLDRVRPVFTAMRAVGVPRDIANEAMTFLLDKLPDDRMLERK